MSITKQTTVWCDKCDGHQTFDTARPNLARAQAKLEGWLYVGASQDLCPMCGAEHRRIAEENGLSVVVPRGPGAAEKRKLRAS